MKTKILLAVLLVLSLHSLGRTKSGIYKNLSDYKSNKLSFDTRCNRKEKIHIHDFFWNSATITVVEDGKKITLKKSELYGFQDCNNDVYRFYKNMEYRIAETANIYIYVQRENIDQNKNNRLIDVYYFSATPDGEILPLNVRNLKEVFRSNDKFIDLLDKYFNSGEVSEYDDAHNTYKINYLFSKSINNNN